MADHSRRLARRWLYIPFTIAGIIVFAYFLLWRAGAAEMKKAVAEWVAEQNDAGLAVSHGAIQSDGFPFFLRVHIVAPDIAEPGAWSWRAERLTLDALPYDLSKLIFSTSGDQVLWAKGHGEWQLRTGDFRASIANDKARKWVFAATIGELHARRSADRRTVTLVDLVLDLAPDATDRSALTLNLAAASLASRVNDREVTIDAFRTSLAVTQTGAFAIDDPAYAWRDAGGALILNGMIAEIGDARLFVSGSLGLDAAFYPAGRLDAEIARPAAFARALAAFGIISAQDAEVAAAALTLTAITGGGKITAPIDLKDGTAQIAGVKLADLPKVN